MAATTTHDAQACDAKRLQGHACNQPHAAADPLGAARAQHVTSGGYGPHAWTCPACIADHAERLARFAETNPHRVGTKAHAKREREDQQVAFATDMRSEAYWSM